MGQICHSRKIAQQKKKLAEKKAEKKNLLVWKKCKKKFSFPILRRRWKPQIFLWHRWHWLPLVIRCDCCHGNTALSHPGIVKTYTTKSMNKIMNLSNIFFLWNSHWSSPTKCVKLIVGHWLHLCGHFRNILRETVVSVMTHSHVFSVILHFSVVVGAADVWGSWVGFLFIEMGRSDTERELAAGGETTAGKNGIPPAAKQWQGTPLSIKYVCECTCDHATLHAWIFVSFVLVHG